MENQWFEWNDHECMWIKSWLLNDSLTKKSNWHEWNKHLNPLNHKDHEYMTTHEPNGPSYMDETRMNVPMNHNRSRTNNRPKINAPMQTWTQRPKTKEFEGTMGLASID